MKLREKSLKLAYFSWNRPQGKLEERYPREEKELLKGRCNLCRWAVGKRKHTHNHYKMK